MKFQSLKKFIINSVYFSIVFIIAISIASLALTRRIHSFQANREPVIFNIQKVNVTISNPVTGRVDKILVKTGDHVQKGQLLIQMSDETLVARISSLETVANQNLSAKTEAALLQLDAHQFEIHAPRDGVIYKIFEGEGAYINKDSTLITMFTDSDVKLDGYVNAATYAELQKDKLLQVYSPRFQQIYSVSLLGVGRVVADLQKKENQYEIQMKFSDPDEGAAFIEGEGLEVLFTQRDDTLQRPADRIASFWNSFIIGK